MIAVNGPGRCFFTLLVVSVMLEGFSIQPALGKQLLTTTKISQETPTGQTVEKLLVSHWQRGPTAVEASRSTFQSTAPADEEVLLAYTLNRIRHNRVSDAIKTVEELTTRFPQNLDAWILKIWLNTLTDNYDVALVNMRSLKRQLAVAKNISPESNRFLYRRLGSLIGYLQGPVADSVNTDLLDGTILNILNGVPADLVKQFNAGRDRTLKRHDDLLKQQGIKVQDELVKVQQANEQEAVALERQNDLLDRATAALLAQRDRLQNDLNRQIQVLTADASSQEQELASIAIQIRSIRIDLQNLYLDLNLILNQPPGLRGSTFFLRDQIRVAEFNLRTLRSNAFLLSNQLAATRDQIAQTRNVLGRQIRHTENELQRTDNSKRRNFKKLEKIARGPVIAGGKRDALRNKATALRTYDDLSVDLYRQQMLDLIVKK